MMKIQRIALASAVIAALLIAACGGNEGNRAGESAGSSTDPGIQHFTFYATPVTIDTTALSVTLDHETIEGYMDAMVMPFHVENSQILGRVIVGKRMLFTIRVANNTTVVTDVRDIHDGK